MVTLIQTGRDPETLDVGNRWLELLLPQDSLIKTKNNKPALKMGTLWWSNRCVPGIQDKRGMWGEPVSKTRRRHWQPSSGWDKMSLLLTLWLFVLRRLSASKNTSRTYKYELSQRRCERATDRTLSLWVTENLFRVFRIFSVYCSRRVRGIREDLQNPTGTLLMWMGSQMPYSV